MPVTPEAGTDHPELVFYPRLIHRVRAALLDSVIMVVAMFAALIVGDACGLAVGNGAKLALVLTPPFILEPLLVAGTGGTLGHHLYNLRVCRDKGLGRLGLFAATLRFVVKTLFGWVSFLTVLASRKHQALHDLLAGSLVVHRHRADLPDYERLPPREADERYRYPAAWRRIGVTLLYGIVLTVILSGLGGAFISAACQLGRRCSAGDLAVDLASSLGWLLALGWLVVRGWGGRLYGARRRLRHQEV